MKTFFSDELTYGDVSHPEYGGSCMDKFHEVGGVSLKWLGQMGVLIETDKR